jgi:hypothetical protein
MCYEEYKLKSVFQNDLKFFSYFVPRTKVGLFIFQLCMFCLNYTFHITINFTEFVLQNRGSLYVKYLQLYVFLIS